MLHTSQLRTRAANGFPAPVKRLGAALLLAVMLPVAASAYTVVLRNGRTVEIPAAFNVTPAGITYEYASGIFVTIQMTSIDVAATERANNEPAGSLQRRAEIPQTRQTVPVSTSPGAKGSTTTTPPKATARRTLTNSDFEASRVRREASESQYERRRKELGLPTAEETRRQREEETRRLSALAIEAEASEAQSEAYWRTRASELRASIATTDAEISYLRAKISETPDYSPSVSFTTLPSFSTFPIVSTPFGRIPRASFPSVPPGALGRTRALSGAPLTGRIGFGGGSTRGRLLINGGETSGYFRRRVGSRPGIAILPLPVYGVPLSYNYSYERSVLVTRLHELEAHRAGLEARWRLLEEEARRAGAPPGWLRP